MKRLLRGILIYHLPNMYSVTVRYIYREIIHKNVHGCTRNIPNLSEYNIAYYE